MCMSFILYAIKTFGFICYPCLVLFVLFFFHPELLLWLLLLGLLFVCFFVVIFFFLFFLLSSLFVMVFFFFSFVFFSFLVSLSSTLQNKYNIFLSLNVINICVYNLQQKYCFIQCCQESVRSMLSLVICFSQMFYCFIIFIFFKGILLSFLKLCLWVFFLVFFNEPILQMEIVNMV